MVILVRLGDPSAKVTDVITDDDTKYVFIEKKDCCMYCSSSGSRMKSKGPHIKQINHSILQGGFRLVLAVSVRKWNCDVCGAYDHDHFTFVEDRKRNSNLVPLTILDKMKDLNVTARQVARSLNVSDTFFYRITLNFSIRNKECLWKSIPVKCIYSHDFILVQLQGFPAHKLPQKSLHDL